MLYQGQRTEPVKQGRKDMMYLGENTHRLLNSKVEATLNVGWLVAGKKGWEL